MGNPLVISLAFVLTVASLVAVNASEWLALGLIILAGIPHGSFDLRVAEARWLPWCRSRLAVLALYLLIGAAMSAVDPALLVGGLWLLCGALVAAALASRGQPPPAIPRAARRARPPLLRLAGAPARPPRHRGRSNRWPPRPGHQRWSRAPLRA
jgi:hypothetical protein